MPCAACGGKSGLSANVTKPKSMILGFNRRRMVRTIQKPRGIIFKPPTGRRAFILGR